MIVQSIPLSQIRVVEPEDTRQRKEFPLDYIQSLATSIRENKLLHPITVEAEDEEGFYLLIAGECRTRAYKLLAETDSAYTSIPASIVERGMGKIARKSIELEENLKRKNLTFQEEIAAVAELRNLIEEKTGTRVGAQNTIAEMLGVSTAKVSADLNLAEAIKEDPNIAKAKTKSEAQKLLLTRNETLIKAIQAKRVESNYLDTETDKIEKMLTSRYIIADCREGLTKLQDNSVDLLELDPPYGIADEEMASFGDRAHAIMYKDDPAKYVDLLDTVADLAYDKMKENSWLTCWCSIYRLSETKAILEKSGYIVEGAPIIWTKNKAVRSRNPSILLAVDYEVCLYARKGRPHLNKQGPSSVYNMSPTRGGVHPNEKPVELLAEILDCFLGPNTVVVSPFLGSGNILLAAYQKRIQAIGFDLGVGYRDAYVLNVHEYLTGVGKEKKVDEKKEILDI